MDVEGTPGYYGNFEEEDGYPLADRIYGHRLFDGQGWMEYLLEFLNVLVGFGYLLGQGTSAEGGARGYKRHARYGLRRFVFYGENEKARDPRDDAALRRLRDALERTVVGENGGAGSPLDIAQELLRSYSAVEASRSWFAKSLFPAHESLLFWEARRKGVTVWRDREVGEEMQSAELDKDIELGTRNFFARGGEVYYLILSAGSRREPDRRRFIQDRLKVLLTESNATIGRLASLVDDTWLQMRREPDGEARDGEERGADAKLGWIPDPDCVLYRAITRDVETLLRAELDPLESLDLLAHLTCFHLLVYIYYRTNLVGENGDGGSELNLGRLMLLVDCLEGRQATLRQASAARYKEHEQLQIRRARRYVRGRITEWATERANDENYVEHLKKKADSYFNVKALRKARRENHDKLVERLKHKLERGELTREEYAERYADGVEDLLLDRFLDRFVPIHRKLARSIGFISPYQGPSQRYVLGDNLLKALVLANVPPGESQEFADFLELLYRRYGIVVDQRAARDSGLYDRRPVNAEYYEDNGAALKHKLKTTSLLEEYSDATAMVVNGYKDTR